MSARFLAVMAAALTVGVLAPAAIANAAPTASVAKTTSIAKQIKALKSAVKSNTATGKKNTATGKSLTAKLKAAGTSITATAATLSGAIKAVDQRVTDLNSKVDGVIGTATSALTALQAGLVQVGDGLKSLGASYTNFEYGVVQVNTLTGTTATPIAGAFLATPRLDPTAEQSTVTGQFACGVAACATDKLDLKVAVRSANPTTNDAASKVYCRVTASEQTGATARFVTSLPNAAFSGAPAYQVARSPLVPTAAAELAAFPLSMVSTDTQVDLTTTTNSTGTSGPGGFALQPSNGVQGGLITVTLSCLTVPNPTT